MKLFCTKISMSYADFFTLIKQNTSNQLDDYKGLCRFCLQNISNGIDISNENYSTKPQRDAIINNHVIITKQYLPISPEYPNFICFSCEANLNDYALFVQQIERNAENWEMFLKSNNGVKVHRDKGHHNEYKPIAINGIEEIKIEYCDEIPVPDTNVYDALDTSLIYSDTKNGIVQIEMESPIDQEMNDINDIPRNMSSREEKRYDKYKPKLFHVSPSTEYERTWKLCNEPTFTSLARLYKHQRQHHPGVKSFTCAICGSKFNNKNRLATHMTDRHAKCGKKHQCQFCAKLFFSDREVKGHEKLHINARSYVCKLCGKGFNQKTILNIHLKSKAHNAEYKTKQTKQKPYKYYRNRNRFRCELCIPTVVFSSSGERAFHRNSIHKKFECHICKNSFMAQESLDSHKLLHSDKPRPFVCTVCNATFNQSSHLASHFKRKHTEEKSFHCTHCDKSFFESCELNAHVRLVHRKQKRVKCDKCESDFATEKYLQKHVLQKHSTEASPYDCKICGKRNENGLRLDVHRLKHHKQ